MTLGSYQGPKDEAIILAAMSGDPTQNEVAEVVKRLREETARADNNAARIKWLEAKQEGMMQVVSIYASGGNRI